MKKIYKILIIIITLYLVFHLIVFIYHTNQRLNNSIPFDYKKILPKNKSEYFINIDIKCNRYFEREIGIIFKPNYVLPREEIFEFDYKIKQDGKMIKQGVSNNNTIYGNVKRVVLITYEPQGSFFCNKQNINIIIKKEKQNIDFSKNELLFYISKPRGL